MALIAAYGMDIYNDAAEWYRQAEIKQISSFGSAGHFTMPSTGGRFGGGNLQLLPGAIRRANFSIQLPSSPTTFFMFVAFKINKITHDTDIIRISGNGSDHVRFRLEDTGDFLEILRVGSNVYQDTITFNVYHTIEMRVVISDSVGELRVLLDGVEIVNLTGVDTNAGNAFVNQVEFLINASASGSPITMNIDDLICWDDSGTENNTFLGRPQHLKNTEFIRYPAAG